MEIIKFHEGCGNVEGCFGPSGNYITIFGTGPEFLILYSIYSIIFGGFLFGILFTYEKASTITSKEKDERKIPVLLKMIIFSIIAAVLFLFFIAYFFPTSNFIQYLILSH